jgi:hypothetical protein
MHSAARNWLLFGMAWLLGSQASAADLKNRSTSRTGQFIVYCDDRELRSRVVSFAEELKADTLQVLRDTDGWSSMRPPIVVTIDPAVPGAKVPPAQVRWVNTVAGPKIDVVVRVGDDPAQIYLQSHLLRAMLLEISYRHGTPPTSNESYAEPPWWLVEGILETIRNRNGLGGADIFKSIVHTEKLPSLERFLAQPPVHLDTAAGAVDRACAMCLVEALLALPNGASNLMRFLEAWPSSAGDVQGALAAQFPVLAGSEHSLAKWWSLHLARFAAGDRALGMGLEETDRQLSGLLSFEVPIDKAGRMQRYEVKDFPNFVKLPAARVALQTQQVKIVTLGANAHPLFRPVLAEYEQILSQLSMKKTRRIAERIAAIEKYRSTIMEQMGQITDYLNWYEATQPAGRTGVFETYIRRAEKMAEPAPVDTRITEYLDQLEQDFAPIAPNAFPGITPQGAASR